MTAAEYAAWWEANELAGARQTEACMDPVWRRHLLDHYRDTIPEAIDRRDDAA